MGELKKFVGIVIVNFRTPDLTILNIQNLVEYTDINSCHVCLIDNFSNDDSVQIISKYINDNKLNKFVSLISSSKNGGFAYGCNLGITYFEKLQTEFVWLLNPDAKILPGAMESLTKFLLENEKVGICGSQLENSDTSVRKAAFRFHSWKTELSRSLCLGIIDWLFYGASKNEDILTAHKCDWVSGASMMLRTSMIEHIGKMDEEYFLYFEEMDYCLKAQRNKWECWHVPQSRVIHIAGSSSGINSVSQREGRRPKYWFDSRRRYFLKNFGKLHALLADISWISGYSLRKLRYFLMGRANRGPRFFLLDSIKNSVFFKGFN